MVMKSLRELVAWCARAPQGVRVPADLVAQLGEAHFEGDSALPEAHDPTTTASPVSEWTWRERVWTAPAETRLGLVEVAEALGRSRSWCYKRTGSEAGDGRLPVRKLDGEIIITVGELRTWIRDHEEIHHGLPMSSSTWERQGLRVVHGGPPR